MFVVMWFEAKPSRVAQLLFLMDLSSCWTTLSLWQALSVWTVRTCYFVMRHVCTLLGCWKYLLVFLFDVGLFKPCLLSIWSCLRDTFMLKWIYVLDYMVWGYCFYTHMKILDYDLKDSSSRYLLKIQITQSFLYE